MSFMDHSLSVAPVSYTSLKPPLFTLFQQSIVLYLAEMASNYFVSAKYNKKEPWTLKIRGQIIHNHPNERVGEVLLGAFGIGG